MKIAPLLALGICVGFASPIVRAQVAAALDEYVADADGYNLVSLGNAAFNQVSDTGGGLAIDGGFSVDNNATTLVGMTWNSSSPSLYVTGQLAITSGQNVKLNNGFASTPGATGWMWSGSPADNLTKTGQGTLHYNSGMTQNPLSAANNPNWAWSTLQSQFQSVSNTLNSASTTGNTISVSGQQFVLSTFQTSGVAVFNLNAALLGNSEYNGQMVTGLQVNVPTGMTYVINVTNLASAASFLSGINVGSGTNDNQLLWNFSGATDSNFTFANGGKFYGSVLAPNLTLTSDTYQEGQLVVGGLTQNEDELDDLNALAPIPIPEPSVYALGLGLFCAAVLAVRRIRGIPANARIC